jgi:hypothetical protein
MPVPSAGLERAMSRGTSEAIETDVGRSEPHVPSEDLVAVTVVRIPPRAPCSPVIIPPIPTTTFGR